MGPWHGSRHARQLPRVVVRRPDRARGAREDPRAYPGGSRDRAIYFRWAPKSNSAAIGASSDPSGRWARNSFASFRNVSE